MPTITAAAAAAAAIEQCNRCGICNLCYAICSSILLFDVNAAAVYFLAFDFLNGVTPIVEFVVVL